ncbi:uncharacterized protein LOC108906392 [Anoplophora glabripennis]|uniref:uncharacterized protein LOC108906392 n=1 Tax=Anoplophora glabripennis TaxID=217634 RepID=UPI000873E222|nr:uncharacterized protein LOC108906392 [Anoplophora glabripennis]
MPHQRGNITALDILLDTRTPPKIKQQVQNKMKIKNEMENSHAGVAIPVDEDSLEMEETTKKLNFYKIERPTTNSGLSTWILLSGQASGATTKSPPTKKPVIKSTPEEKQNVTIVNDKPTRIIKPIFKQRPTTTLKPSTTTTAPTTTAAKTTTKLTKVKASALNSSHKKSSTTTEHTTKKPNTVTSLTTVKTISSTHLAVVKNATAENTTLSATDSSALPLESKNGEVDLPNTDNKKKKNTNKRKKNKTRRRKPGDKGTNSTSIAKPTKILKNKPYGTQLYNYLAREIMPTVGVGLVGLMVTAGLASYFLYPFGVARRSYEIDRKDKEGSYYYSDDYSGGMPEEEAIGKVIAGMPGNSLFENSYKSPASRNAYLNSKNRLSDRRAQIQRNAYSGMVQGTVENVPITSTKHENEKPSYPSNSYEPVSYSTDLDSRYPPTVDQKFVVGNIPKEVVTEVTPAAVPEHGPRNLNFETNYAEEPIFVVGNPPQEFTRNIKLDTVPAQRPRSLKVRRKRSDIPNDIDNEIVSNLDKEEATTISVVDATTTETPSSPSSTNTPEKIETTTSGIQTITGLPDKLNSFIDLMKELIHFKARLGLQMIQNATKSISTYISRIQTRLDQDYRDYSKNKH